MDWSLWSIRKKITMSTKKLELKQQSSEQTCVILVMHILLWKEITVTEWNEPKRNKRVAFKNNVLFIKCIAKINGIQIDNAIVISMYNLRQYSKNYRKTTGKLWNYYRDKPSNHLSSNSESFK